MSTRARVTAVGRRLLRRVLPPLVPSSPRPRTASSFESRRAPPRRDVPMRAPVVVVACRCRLRRGFVRPLSRRPACASPWRLLFPSAPCSYRPPPTAAGRCAPPPAVPSAVAAATRPPRARFCSDAPAGPRTPTTVRTHHRPAKPPKDIATAFGESGSPNEFGVERRRAFEGSSARPRRAPLARPARAMVCKGGVARIFGCNFLIEPFCRCFFFRLRSTMMLQFCGDEAGLKPMKKR